MSWDISVQNLPAGIRNVAEIPDDFRPDPLGSRAQLIERIRKFAPGTRFTDAAWGSFEAPSFSIEFNLGESDPVYSFAMHVRGDDAATAFVADLLAYLEYPALDPQSSSGLFEAGTVAAASLKRWRDYRDRIVGQRAV
jgi:hypothetical protein